MANTLKPIAFVATAIFMLTASCGDSTGEHATTPDTTIAQAASLPAVVISPVGSSPEFPDARLALRAVKANLQGKDSTKLSFEFDIKNYELKNQTSDATNKQCNNSDKGQHIHFILDNAPYTALYEPKHEIVVANDNKEHYLICFLSRSYHESVKSKDAAIIYHFKVNEKGGLEKLEDPKTPMLFYSRPKGDYLGKDTANLLLDFYVWNASLGSDYKVKAEIVNETNGQSMNTEITAWEPQFIKNLGTGKAHVTLTLVDKEGKPVEGQSVTRNIQLAAQEPLK